jgi:hypothetical protein
MGLGARSTTTQIACLFLNADNGEGAAKTDATASPRRHRGTEHLDLAAESSVSVTFGLIALHVPHRRLARIDKFQLDRSLAENADDGGLFAAAPDAVIVRGVGDAAHEAA